MVLAALRKYEQRLVGVLPSLCRGSRALRGTGKVKGKGGNGAHCWCCCLGRAHRFVSHTAATYPTHLLFLWGTSTTCSEPFPPEEKKDCFSKTLARTLPQTSLLFFSLFFFLSFSLFFSSSFSFLPFFLFLLLLLSFSLFFFLLSFLSFLSFFRMSWSWDRIAACPQSP